MTLLSSGSAGEVESYLQVLSDVNRNGSGFLLAFGLTWLAAGLIWARWGDRAGSYAALFQGMVGTPLGLLLTWATATGARPDDPTMNALSVHLGVGQLLVLPLAVVLIVRRRYVDAVSVLVVVLAVHFVPYSWLYGTPVYLVVAAAVAVLAAVLVATHASRPSRTGPGLCLGTSACLLLGGLAALVS